MGDLTRNFSRKEFTCPCCGDDRISPSLVRQLQDARDYACLKAGRTVRFRIASGVRCRKHNAAVGGKKDSAHIPKKIKILSGDLIASHAADLAAASSPNRYYILYGLMMAGFDRIGVDRTYIHADDDVTRPAQVVWHYYPKK